jgi:hypothetical protein
VSDRKVEEMPNETAVAPPIVTAMVVYRPGAWFDEVLVGLAGQNYSNISHVFFLTTTVDSTGVDMSDAERVSKKITETLPNSVVRIVEGNPGFGRLINA